MTFYPGDDLLQTALGVCPVIAQGDAADQGFPPAVLIIQLSDCEIELLSEPVQQWPELAPFFF